jgi:hypothetical protein
VSGSSSLGFLSTSNLDNVEFGKSSHPPSGSNWFWIGMTTARPITELINRNHIDILKKPRNRSSASEDDQPDLPHKHQDLRLPKFLRLRPSILAVSMKIDRVIALAICCLFRIRLAITRKFLNLAVERAPCRSAAIVFLTRKRLRMPTVQEEQQ